MTGRLFLCAQRLCPENTCFSDSQIGYTEAWIYGTFRDCVEEGFSDTLSGFTDLLIGNIPWQIERNGMSEKIDLQKEEFVQNYLQYRWLDQTRSKLIDRFLIVLVAILGVRFQFSQFLERHFSWLLILHVLFVFMAVCMAKSIISFRRQQRGHSLYINAVRSQILGETGVKEDQYLQQLGEYRSYINGRKVYLTRWIEFVVAAVATVSPLLFAFDVLYPRTEQLGFRLSIILGCGMIAFALLISWFVLWPCYKYNYKESLNWEKD